MSVPQASAKQEGSKARVTGLVPPIATPFRDGALDLDSLHRLLDDLSDHVSGVLVGGSVGEAASMTIEERITVMREVDRGLDRNRQYLAVSVSDNSIEYSRELAYAAGEVGADVAMVSCPNYFTNDSAMLEAYFAALSDFTPCDLCLYDNPIASHTTPSIPDIVRLTVAAPRLTHVKVTDTSVDKVAALRDATDLQVLAGDDAVLWHQLTRGRKGGGRAVLAEHADGAAEQDRDDQHLQDVAFGEGVDQRRRDQLHDEGHRAALHLADPVVVGCHRRRVQPGRVDVHADAGLEHVGEDDADHQREAGEHLEVDDRLEADAADLLQVASARDAEHHHAEHERGDHHLDQLDEAVAQAASAPGKIGDQHPQDHTEHQRHNDLAEQ